MATAEPLPRLDPDKLPTVFGHPTGLFTLFFAEMWERFSYYGMRALLVYYLTKGFMGYGDSNAYAVYGFYTALVYMTPFFGGLIADRILGSRLSVVIGGLLMASGHLLMTVENQLALFSALALLICGNGFFKPNISTIVGTLYSPTSRRRDGGFTIFYIGINLGAAMAPLVCGYIGETYGWHYGFGLATVGMLTGVAVFVAPDLLTQLMAFAAALIAATGLVATFPGSGLETRVVDTFGSVATFKLVTNWVTAALVVLVGINAVRKKRLRILAPVPITQAIIIVFSLGAVFLLYQFHAANNISKGLNYFVGLALILSCSIAVLALFRGRLPAEAGAPNVPERLDYPVFGFLPARWAVVVGTAIAVPIFALLVSGFAPFTADKSPVSMIPESVVERFSTSQRGIDQVLAVFVQEVSRPAGLVLFLSGVIAVFYLGMETFRLKKVPRERMFVVLILTFFSMLFWAFFEQAGSSINLFTDRNVDRVFEGKHITASEIGQTIKIQPTQEQLGFHNGAELFLMADLTRLREANAANPDFEIDWTVAPDNEGMGVARRIDEIPATTFQSVNPIFIMIFGLVFTTLWGILGSLRLEPSTPLKFSLGLLQLGLGFLALYYGAAQSSDRGMVALSWLFLGYLLHTTGELCLSPVGLSMITKLSPKQLVSTTMGMWFLATAFSQYLAAIISQFTGVTHGEGDAQVVPAPAETVHVYGDVFYSIAIAAMISAAICLVMVPVLKYWMHEGVQETDDGKKPAV